MSWPDSGRPSVTHFLDWSTLHPLCTGRLQLDGCPTRGWMKSDRFAKESLDEIDCHDCHMAMYNSNGCQQCSDVKNTVVIKSVMEA